MTPTMMWFGAIPALKKALSTCSRSCVPIEEPSPVVPNRVTLEHPEARLNLACLIIGSMAISPLLSKGVVSATDRPNFCDKFHSSQMCCQYIQTNMLVV